ncbi:MAG TPA: alpha/beta hydrolase [Allosphingosinicella sp.]|nr:alpha/beta hydrolase [Allosphingosinicella sp.]
MSGNETLDRPGGRIAYRRSAGRGPAIIFLPGYRSDMEGGKATALDAWAEAEGRAMIRFDYSGCGISDGDFETQSLADWRDDVLAIVDQVAEGPVVLVGSSMGGWLMLLAALARPDRVAGLVGIAAAPDFTSWGFDAHQKDVIATAGKLEEPNSYDDQPYVTTRIFWESGESLKLLDAPIPITCPVRLLHGLADADVPWRISLHILEQIEAEDAHLCLIKDGDHRLSREPDIERLIGTVEALLGRI